MTSSFNLFERSESAGLEPNKATGNGSVIDGEGKLSLFRLLKYPFLRDISSILDVVVKPKSIFNESCLTILDMWLVILNL